QVIDGFRGPPLGDQHERGQERLLAAQAGGWRDLVQQRTAAGKIPRLIEAEGQVQRGDVVLAVLVAEAAQDAGRGVEAARLDVRERQVAGGEPPQLPVDPVENRRGALAVAKRV